VTVTVALGLAPLPSTRSWSALSSDLVTTIEEAALASERAFWGSGHHIFGDV
jgi:hypothetical protein